ncbi:hypothetical protein GCM10015535_37370 [Streptomyces gelaticus]|uniref:WXG100 family type VII secretion target n=1 Tax=Streptomyces gelaticus TaxID=285446 RepID=A0ABQ2W397_9ACTN|nr:hypothetical protein [Streptomyces gelaticus]GGV87532.1 hypothetical protein GCM10015535_37370 [Streptomyces gelaticus]
MAEGTLSVPSDLPQRFTQFGTIARIVGELGVLNDNINLANRTAGGRDDVYAKEYHKFVDSAGKGLTYGLEGLSDLLEMVGISGNNASVILNDAETDANHMAAG